MAGELVSSSTIVRRSSRSCSSCSPRPASWSTPRPTAKRARARRARSGPTLILLDFVMPKMNGYQVCRALAESRARDIPVVLMSAKGDQVGERFVKVMGIVDYITKPFSPEAITAVVQHTIEKYRAGPTSEDNPSLVTGEDLAADRRRRQGARADGGARRSCAPSSPTSWARGSRRCSRSRTRRRTPARRSRMIAKVATDAAAIADAARAALDDARADEFARRRSISGCSPRAARAARRPARGAAGRGAQLLDVQEQCGVLTVERTRRARRHLLPARAHRSGGRAIGVPDEFLLGRFVLDARADAARGLRSFLSRAQQHARREPIGAAAGEARLPGARPD